MEKTNSRHKIVSGLICKNCGNPFSTREQRVKTGLGIFCSRKCSSLWKAKQSGKKYVGKENGKLSFDKIKGCYYVYWFEPDTLKRRTTSYARWWWETNKGEVPDGYRASYKDHDPMNTDPNNICLISLKEYGITVSRRLMGHGFSSKTLEKMSNIKKGKPLSDEHKKNISDSLYRRWESGEFDTIHVGKHHRLWKGGVKIYPRKFSERLKLKIKRRDGFRCKSCGTDVYGSRSGHVHHVDGDKQNCEDVNLVLLCSTCHLAIHGKSNITSDEIKYYRSKLL
jgi:transcription elongation factor Elf1